MDQLIGLLAMYIWPLVVCSLYIRRMYGGYVTKEGIVIDSNEELIRSLWWIGAITPLFNFVLMLFIVPLVLMRKR